jgi:hypothetical protein
MDDISSNTEDDSDNAEEMEVPCVSNISNDDAIQTNAGDI